jgi:AraC-like DNA-binding protein
MALATDWRLSLTADLLPEPDATIGSVAYQVGYTTPYALSTAFKRVRGVGPRQHRLAAASTWPTPMRPPFSASPPRCRGTP